MNAGARLGQWSVVGTLTLALLAGCRRTDDPSELTLASGTPVVLISIDTLRSDHLPAYGYSGVETPAIDRLRREGILFRHAYAPVPLTLPSHVSLLTGLLPVAHGVRDNVGYVLEAGRLPYLPRLLKQAGYATGAVVSAYVLRGATGLRSDFDFYDDTIALRADIAAGGLSRPGGESLAAARGWLRSVAERPFFLFFHLYEPHMPYEPPEPFRSRSPSAYDGEIAAADAVVGGLLEELERLGVYDRALILLVSDHGEGLGDHGEEEHGILLYREAVQVPLLLRLPGGRFAGRTAEAPAQLLDILPTIAILLARAVPAPATGTSLLELLGPEAPMRTVLSETFYPRIHFGWSELLSATDSRHHYIEGPDPELYDLLADPGERQNLLGAERRAASALRGALAGYDRALAPPAAPDSETRQRLAALGYLTGATAAGAEGGPLPDPKQKLPSLADLKLAAELFRKQDFRAANFAFRRVLKENPLVLDAWEHLARGHEALGEPTQALAAYREALRLSRGDPDLALSVGALELRVGERKRARETIAYAQQTGRASPQMLLLAARELRSHGEPRAALAILEPLAQRGEPAALRALALTLSEAGEQARAHAALERALAAEPQNAETHELLGLVALERGDLRAARAHSEQAVALDPSRAQAWNHLGVALYSLGERGAALRAWKRAVETDPELYDALYNLGVKAAELGAVEEARQALSSFLERAPRDRYAADFQHARALLRQLGGAG